VTAVTGTSRTVDRALLHRRNPSEVFLTGAERTGEDTYTATALLPVTHPHYTAHTAAATRALDPMLLLECCRQAETYAAHVFFGVERDAAFVLREWSAEVLARADGHREVVISAVTADRVVVGGRTRRLDHLFTVGLGGVPVARVTMRVGYLAHAAYTALRARGRDRPPPSSDRVSPVAGCPVTPLRVGRVRATDVLLCDAVSRPDSVTASLRTPLENPSMFDHAHDHVPGSVLLEAGRQLAVLGAHHWDGTAPGHGTMVAMDGSFAAYCELDRPTVLTATPAGAGRVAVAVDQRGTRVAELTVGVGS
jgi:hypothetical protein